MNYKSNRTLDRKYDTSLYSYFFLLFSHIKFVFDFVRLEHGNYFEKSTISTKLSSLMGMIYLDAKFSAKHRKSMSE